MDNNLWTFLGTAITFIFGSAAWRYYEKRANRRERDEDFIRHDCKDRIAKLEALLEQSNKEKDETNKLIVTLTKEVAELRIKVEFLTKENTKLEKSLLNG